MGCRGDGGGRLKGLERKGTLRIVSRITQARFRIRVAGQ